DLGRQRAAEEAGVAGEAGVEDADLDALAGEAGPVPGVGAGALDALADVERPGEVAGRVEDLRHLHVDDRILGGDLVDQRPAAALGLDAPDDLERDGDLELAAAAVQDLDAELL